MAEIILAKSSGSIEKVLVDAEDFARLSQMRWYVNAARGRSVYSVIRLLPGSLRTVYMSRMIMRARPDEYVDHINGDPCDNRKENLRVTTPQQNSENRHGVCSSNTSGFRGVSYSKQLNKWQAYYCKNYKKYSVGFFDNLEAAHAAVTLARRQNMPFSEADKEPAYTESKTEPYESKMVYDLAA